MGISVIVPVYMVESYLHRCVDSILSQTFVDFELILVDDGSPDNCGAICDEYAAKDSRIRVIHQKNGGLSAARNAGLDVAREEYYAFVDGDDWIHPQFLELLYSAVKKHGLLMACCNIARVADEKEAVIDLLFPVVLVKLPDEVYINIKGTRVVPSACRILCHRDLFKNIRFPVGYLSEDLFTTYKLYFQCEKIACVDAPLYFYFQRQGSIMLSKWNEEKLKTLTKYRELIAFFSSRQHNTVFHAVILQYLHNLRFHYAEVVNCKLFWPKKVWIKFRLRLDFYFTYFLHGKHAYISKEEFLEIMKVVSPFAYRCYDLIAAIKANLHDRIRGVRK